jgi:hypothetical protein
MSKLGTLEREIRNFSPQEIARVRAWLDELEANAWDEQIEADGLAGNFDG